MIRNTETRQTFIASLFETGTVPLGIGSKQEKI